MKTPLPYLRPVALLVILVMVGVAVSGFYSIRKGVENLQIIGRDNAVWTATQMEIEFLKFQRSLAVFVSERTPEALDEAQKWFDILVSRYHLQGREGAELRAHDEGLGALTSVSDYISSHNELMEKLRPEADMAPVQAMLREMEAMHHRMRDYSLRVIDASAAANSLVRDRVRSGAMVTASIALVALLICLGTLVLIARENRRQREMAALNLRLAQEAEAATRAKSRFLSMMSHELRNPLNGVLGPLALIRQTGLGDAASRLLDRSQQAGRLMSRMLGSLLDYGDIEDSRLVLEREPIRLGALAAEVSAALADAEPAAPRIAIGVAEGAPDLVRGDLNRLAQTFAYLAEHLQADDVRPVALTFDHAGDNLIGDFRAEGPLDPGRWTVGFIASQAGGAGRALSADSLAPIIVRGLLRAQGGLIRLLSDAGGRHVIRVLIPAERIVLSRIRIRIETLSAAMATLYRAALRSDRVTFVEDGAEDSTADIVLVDSTSAPGQAALEALRARFPHALFVALGTTPTPGLFDEVLRGPADIADLRTRVLARLAS